VDAFDADGAAKTPTQSLEATAEEEQRAAPVRGMHDILFTCSKALEEADIIGYANSRRSSRSGELIGAATSSARGGALLSGSSA
jgi:hypothetical protein